MYTRSFDADGQLKTHPVGSDTRTLTYDAAKQAWTFVIEAGQQHGSGQHFARYDIRRK